ncbi:hypothetical protein WH367_16575 [Comamonas sp. MYb21]|uniref:hypothetical protein n=1 Tax=Comamonas sp. MYb21 TaxID=1848648 RepID=UPI0030A474C3
MEEKHTPGPWSYHDDAGYCAQIDGANGAVVCCFDQDPHDADAHLMTTAPELLEFIKEWLDRQGGDANYMTEKARALIAKATS